MKIPRPTTFAEALAIDQDGILLGEDIRLAFQMASGIGVSAIFGVLMRNPHVFTRKNVVSFNGAVLGFVVMALVYPLLFFVCSDMSVAALAHSVTNSTIFLQIVLAVMTLKRAVQTGIEF
jgi:hypothetical protein